MEAWVLVNERDPGMGTPVPGNRRNVSTASHIIGAIRSRELPVVLPGCQGGTAEVGLSLSILMGTRSKGKSTLTGNGFFTHRRYSD